MTMFLVRTPQQICAELAEVLLGPPPLRRLIDELVRNPNVSEKIIRLRLGYERVKVAEVFVQVPQETIESIVQSFNERRGK